jgi:hypothetical protein
MITMSAISISGRWGADMREKRICCGLVLLLELLLTAAGVCYAAERTVSEGKVSPTGRTLFFNFDTDRTGGLPARAELFSGEWVVRAEPGAPSPPNALCQTGSANYPALSLGGMAYRDMTISVRFKPVSGTSDRAAGIIFRVQDQNNYYILRANALEDNVNLYKYERGRRSLIKEGTVKVPSGVWQELRVEVTGITMRGFLNGRLVVEASDDTFKSGKVGLWTKADSVTCFDNIEITPR